MSSRTLRLALALIAAATSAAAQDLVITNAFVIVGNGQVIERGAIVVRGGRIAAVGAAAAAGVPNAPGVRTIDAKGMTAMAGFIDGHRHIMGGNAEQYFQKRAQAHMMEFLEAGYTTLLDGGGTIPAITQLKERVDSGQLKGPRIITSARADPDNYKTEAEARARVREIVTAGVEFIKVRIEPPADPREVAILTAVADEAKKLNRHVMVHAVSPKAMLAAVKAGATKLVHTPHNGWLTIEEALAVKNAGIEVLSCVGFGVPVFGVHNQENRPTFRDGKPWPESINNVQPPRRGIEAGEKAVNARTLWDAGVVFGYGTDTGYAVKAGLAHELRALSLMFSPQDLIRLLGPNTAAFLDREKELGTLEPGKLADIVLLDGNPLEGYWHLLGTKVVVKGGTVMVDKR